MKDTGPDEPRGSSQKKIETGPQAFAYGRIPFEERESVVLDQLAGANAEEWNSGMSFIEAYKGLKADFDGQERIQDRTLHPWVKCYHVTDTSWEMVAEIDLWFTAPYQSKDAGTLFMARKVLREDKVPGFGEFFGDMKERIAREVNSQPREYSTSFVDFFNADSITGRITIPAKVAVWDLPDVTVWLIANAPVGTSMNPQIIYRSKSGWGKYLVAVKTSDEADERARKAQTDKAAGQF